MNPCTLGFYLPLLVRDVPGALQPSDEAHVPGASTASRRTQNDGRARGANPHAQNSDHVPNARRLPADPGNPSTVPSPASALSPAKRRRSASPSVPVPPPAAAPVPISMPVPGGERERERERAGWKELDAKFRRDLPDEAYAARLAYRGLVMRACPAIRVLDGVEATDKERDKAERLLRSVLDVRRPLAQTQPGQGHGRGLLLPVV